MNFSLHPFNPRPHKYLSSREKRTRGDERNTHCVNLFMKQSFTKFADLRIFTILKQRGYHLNYGDTLDKARNTIMFKIYSLF